MLHSRASSAHHEKPPDLWRPYNAAAGVHLPCGSIAGMVLQPPEPSAAVCKLAGCCCSRCPKAQNVIAPFQATCGQNHTARSQLPQTH